MTPTDSKDISNHTSATLGASSHLEPVLSFAQIQALIEAGKLDEIPNNKIIAGDLNVRLGCCLDVFLAHYPSRPLLLPNLQSHLGGNHGKLLTMLWPCRALYFQC